MTHLPALTRMFQVASDLISHVPGTILQESQLFQNFRLNTLVDKVAQKKIQNIFVSSCE